MASTDTKTTQVDSSVDTKVDASVKTINEDAPVEFIGKVKSFVKKFVQTNTLQYIEMLHSRSDKKVSIDEKSCVQVAYMMSRVLAFAIDAESCHIVPDENVGDWMTSLARSTDKSAIMYNYMAYTVSDVRYLLLGEPAEEELLHILVYYIEEESVLQHVVELMLLFMKSFSRRVADYCHSAPKRVNTGITNFILRGLGKADGNTDIFDVAHDYYDVYKGLSKK
jgi:hypothetical protein